MTSVHTVSEPRPTLSQRATFVWMFVAMAKDYGYTRTQLCGDLRAAWAHVADKSRKARSK